MTPTPIYFYKKNTLTNLKPDSLIALKAKEEDNFSLWVTDKQGLSYPLKTDSVKKGDDISILNNDAGYITLLDIEDSLITRTDQLENTGASNTSKYVEEADLGTTAFSNNFEDLHNKPNKIKKYQDITELILNQPTQKEGDVFEVSDSSSDTNITFTLGEQRRQAFYKFDGAAMGLISDYTLVSVPYGNHIEVADEISWSVENWD